MTKMVTQAPGRDVILFDGHCRLCSRAARQLAGLLGSSRTELRSFRQPGVLEAFPGVSLERCERRIQLVRADGEVFEGAEALVRALSSRPLGWLLFIYYVPGLRRLVDVAYSLVARYRFRLMGRECPDEGCAIHLK